MEQGVRSSVGWGGLNLRVAVGGALWLFVLGHMGGGAGYGCQWNLTLQCREGAECAHRPPCAARGGQACVRACVHACVTNTACVLCSHTILPATCLGHFLPDRQPDSRLLSGAGEGGGQGKGLARPQGSAGKQREARGWPWTLPVLAGTGRRQRPEVGAQRAAPSPRGQNSGRSRPRLQAGCWRVQTEQALCNYWFSARGGAPRERRKLQIRSQRYLLAREPVCLGVDTQKPVSSTNVCGALSMPHTQLLPASAAASGIN